MDKIKGLLMRSPRAYEMVRRIFGPLRYRLRRAHDPDFAAFALFDAREGLFLDIGANAGMSAYSFRLFRNNPILSIEPNPFHEPDLRRAQRKLHDFSYKLVAAGSEPGALTLTVPVYRGVPFTTEASASRSERTLAAGTTIRRRVRRFDATKLYFEYRTVPVVRLDDFHLTLAFVKLDVEGFELPALEGLTNTLIRSKPILMVEHPSEAVRSLLLAMDYVAFVYRDGSLVESDDDARNVFFVVAQAAHFESPRRRPTGEMMPL